MKKHGFSLLVFLVVAGVITIWMKPLMAADLTSRNAAEQSSQNLSAGGFSGSLSVDRSSAVLLGEQDKIEDVNVTRVSSTFAYGVSSNVQLSLNLRGVREMQLPGAAEKDQEAKNQMSFAGATLMSKWHILTGDGWRLAVAPLADSGAGSSAQQSFARSSRSSYGLGIITGYGQHKVADIETGVFYRHRDTEAFLNDLYGSQIQYNATGKIYLGGEVALFASGVGQATEVTRSSGEKAGKKQFISTADALGGLALEWESTQWQAFAGSHVLAETAAKGKAFFGLMVTFITGSGNERAGRTSYADEVGSQIDKKSAKAKNKNGSTANDDLPQELQTNDVDNIDYAADLDPSAAHQNDFYEVEQKLKRTQKTREKNMAEQDRVERQVREMKDAEKKAEQEKMRREEAERQEAARESAIYSKANSAKRQKYMKEAEEEVQKIPTITKDELYWNGLEE